MEKLIEKEKEGNELSGSNNWSGCSLCTQFPWCEFPTISHRFPEFYLTNSCPALKFWNLPLLPTFSTLFEVGTFPLAGLNAEPQWSCSCSSRLILSPRGLYPTSWAIRKKWASHRNSPFTLTWDTTSCDTVLPGEASRRQFPELCPH